MAVDILLPDKITTKFNSGGPNVKSDQTNTDIAVSVQNVSKMYPFYAKPNDRLKQSLWYALPQFLRHKPRRFYREFWALRDVSFEVKKGESMGIIGQNGSGKSTLLQIIAGTLALTEGEVQVNGRVTALLELGSGFNSNFTGRENVYMNGAILGFSRKEVDELFDEIAAFADIGDFIDQPVKTYSSGMYVRLAFAVAVCVDPDVLIIDEALAVGDAVYKSRSYRRMKEMRDAGKTIILVTHSFPTAQSFCDRAILLDAGGILKIGEAKPVVNKYIELTTTREREYVEKLARQAKDKPPPSSASETKQVASQLKSTEQETIWQEFRYGNRSAAEIIDYYLLDEEGKETVAWQTGEIGTIVVVTKFHKTVERPVVGFIVSTPTGVNVFGTNSWYAGNEPSLQQQGTVLKTEFRQQIKLNLGDYILSCGVVERKNDQSLPLDRRYDVLSFKVIGPEKIVGIIDAQTEINYEQLNKNE